MEKQGRTHVTFFYGPLHMDEQVLVTKHEF